MDRYRAIGIALVLVSACAFGSGALIGKPVYALGVGWVTLLAWRFTVGAGLSWAWLLARPDGRAVLVATGRRATLVALGLGIIYVGNAGTYYAALETVPASLAGLLVYIYPVLVAVLSIRYAQPLEGRRPWIALALAVTGVALSLGGIPADAMPPLSGLVLLIASPVIYSVWIILAARLSGERAGPVPDSRSFDEPTSGDPAADESERAATTVSSAVMMTATAAVFVGLAAVTAAPLLPGAVPSDAWPGLIALGVVTTFVAIQTFTAGAQRVGAAQAALLSTIEPLYTIVFAALLFGERLAPIQIVGAALILSAVILAQTSPAGAVRGLRSRFRLADE